MLAQDSPAANEPSLEELKSLQRRNAELTLLYDTIRDLNSTLSVREVLDRLMTRALGHLESEIGSILLLDKDGCLRIIVARGLPQEVVHETSVGMGDGISGYVASTGEAVLVTDIENDSRFQRHNHERYYTTSLISAPLLQMGSVRGVVNINNKRSRDIFQPADLQLLEALAGHAAVALANAHRYEAVLERAQRDSLTGLANHGHMWSALDVEFARAARHGRSLSVVMIDIDHFKAYNDRFGHPAGDEALCTVARQLEAISRSHDVVARYGGEEFAVILPETSSDGAERYAEKIRCSIESEGFGPERRERLTVSAGVAESREGVTTPQELIALADNRLYAAKAKGRNRVLVRA